jgi:translation elongation factor EF-Ts
MHGPNITIQQVAELRRTTGMGIEEARDYLKREHFEAMVHGAKTIEDLKPVLIHLLHRKS